MNSLSGRNGESADESNPGGPQSGNRSLRARSKVGGIAVVLLLGIYSLSAPQLNARFGWNLPQIRTDAQGNVQVADSTSKSQRNNRAKPAPTQALPANPGPTDSDGGEPIPGAATEKPSSESERAGDAEQSADSDLLYGVLREISHDRFLSPAGLLYTPGSAEGHRLEHLRRHTKDDPRRPGSHGVFDGDMEGALKTIDRAYERAKKGQRTTKKVDQGRTIYTVDLGGRVGYVGGRDGGRRRKPMARRVRLVLEGNRVITAYPM